MINENGTPFSNLEERKLKEIEHSRQRRSIMRGYERISDTHPDEEVQGLEVLIHDKDAFDRHFSNVKYYSVASASEEYVKNWLKERCAGKKALDYCCGNGEFAIFMAGCGAEAFGIDISPEGIENAKLNATHAGVENHCRFEVMDGEALDFPDETFDVIVEWGALHHLDFDKSMQELRRICKPDGQIICIEALCHNPFIHLYRKMTMHLRTEWEVEHILTVGHLDRAAQYFSSVNNRFFHLFALAAVPFRKTSWFKSLRASLDAIDNFVLRPRWFGKYAWIMVFTLSNPKK